MVIVCNENWQAPLFLDHWAYIIKKNTQKHTNMQCTFIKCHAHTHVLHAS